MGIVLRIVESHVVQPMRAHPTDADCLSVAGGVRRSESNFDCCFIKAARPCVAYLPLRASRPLPLADARHARAAESLLACYLLFA